MEYRHFLPFRIIHISVDEQYWTHLIKFVSQTNREDNVYDGGD